MIIELKEYELPKGKKMFDVDAYNGDGLFLVNDGITMNIVSVPKLGDAPMIIPVPFNMLNRYIRHKSYKETEADIAAKIIGRLDDMSNNINKLIEYKEMQSVPQIYHEEKIDGETLLKAIALSQNPELAKELLLEK